MAWFTQFAAKLLTLPTGKQDLLVLVDLAERFVAATARDIMLMVMMVLAMIIICGEVCALEIDSSLK